MSKVVKFGGSSLASAAQFKKVGDIIRSDEDRRFVVPSAPGKRDARDTKVTDMLYACYDLAENDQPFEKELEDIHARITFRIFNIILTFFKYFICIFNLNITHKSTPRAYYNTLLTFYIFF